MISIIIAYDDNDLELGEYFEYSFNDLNNNFNHISDISITSLRGLECKEDTIISITKDINDEFIFIGLSHGNKNQLLTENEVFVDVENTSHFKKSLFYTPSCSTGLNLGAKLIANGCTTFIGCKKDTLATFEDFNSIYIQCENYCINYFVNTNSTIQESFKNMLDFYDMQIDLLIEKCDDDVLLAMELQHNKDSFILLGNKTITIADFNKN
jgi:hypothetical protein